MIYKSYPNINYRNCITCGGDFCSNCTEEGCITPKGNNLIELFADDWKGNGESCGMPINYTSCNHGKLEYKDKYCFKDHCPSGIKKEKYYWTCKGVTSATDGVSILLILLFIIIFITII